jgi:GNAT superfamily N-acetyltransferase
LIEDEVAGVAIAFRSQEAPDEVYIQDVMTAPEHRRKGVAKVLLSHVRDQAISWGAKRIYLTSEPENRPARVTWEQEGYVNRRGDFLVDGIWVVRDFKGPGKHRAVYDHHLD